MTVTQDERDRGILVLTSMRLDEFMKVIDAKISELNDKAKVYLEECIADYHQYKGATPHEIETAIELHKQYIANLKNMLQDLKETCKKNLHKDYLVPTIIVETFIELARKATALKYVKMQPSVQRVA
ncbi:MAG: hypothetical protein Kow009_05170 [Spirochaetales bacterium]